MHYTIREFESEGKFSQALKLEAFYECAAGQSDPGVLAETGRHTQRERN